jgi:pSer/pThr/pTyr-binding forkhead associated (FHA) protein
MPVQWTLILPALAGKEPQPIELSGTLTVGRASSNDIIVDDSNTSSSHATLEQRGDELFIRDLGSTNGTTIDGGARLTMGEWTPLRNGARLRIGVINTKVVGKEVVDLDATLAAPRPAKAVSSPPVPAAPAPAPGVDPMVDPPLSQSFSSTMQDVDAGPGAGAAAAHALEQMEARLILLDEVDPRAIRISEMSQKIGRSKSVSCRIDSKLVSSEHAELTFSPRTSAFQIEDLGSSNHTVLNRGTLTPKVAHLLDLDSALQFGPIEAVFRVDHHVDGTRVPAGFDLQVAEVLIASGKITTADVQSAKAFAKETSGFIGDGLLLGGLVSPNDWAEAARAVRQSAPVLTYRESGSAGWLSKLLVLVLLLALGVAAVYLFGPEEFVAKLPELPSLRGSE